MSETVGAFAAKTHLSELLDRVERGEEIIITRHGKAIAKLAPAESPDDSEKARAAARKLRALAGEIRPGTFDWQAWKKFRDAGRK
jgi:prevent-host-death family protein